MSTDVVQKLWGFCHTLRHDGIDYGDYIEQITYLLFLKMADERAALLDRECAGDRALRQELESLLAHDMPRSTIAWSPHPIDGPPLVAGAAVAAMEPPYFGSNRSLNVSARS